MSKKMLIDATHSEETRVVVVDGKKVDEFDFESLNKRQLSGNIYLAKVTRVEPSLQAAFVDYGGNRHGFLAFSEIHPDYYQIPVADREALMAEQAAEEEARRQEEEEREAARAKQAESGGRRSRSRSRSKAATATAEDAVVTEEVPTDTAGATVDGGDVSTEETVTDADAVAAVEADEKPVDAVVTEDAPAEALDEALPEAAERAGMEPSEHQGDGPDVEGAESGLGQPADIVETPESGDAPADVAAETSADVEGDQDEDDDDSDDEVEEVRRETRRRPRARRYKIQEVIKVRQIMLIQVVKEERGNKGAALTTYLSLAGRYCVLMPNTARGGGISRKITNAPDRKKLKEIANEIEVPQGAGLIIRTAGAKRTRTEIKRDYEYLIRQWEQIRDLTMKSVAPKLIYEEGSLIKRSIRDLYGREIDEVFVEGADGYREAKDYMRMLMPSHAKNVKLYQDQVSLFGRHQVESYLAQMFNPTVQLKSGGYLVIGVTEALVAVDVNSGRSTKEGSIEETALKTNLEAAEEVARQLRLRDLAGLIVIDFIDMDERRNNSAVEKRMKEALKNDRARIQVGRISSFGLMEMSRQRLRPGMLEASTQPCPACHGTGLVRSNDSLGLSIIRELEEEGVRQRCKEIVLTCPVDVANYLLNAKREHIAMIETRYGIAIQINGDAHLVSPDFKMERFKTASRVVVQDATAGAIQIDSLDLAREAELDAAAAAAEPEDVQEAEAHTETDDQPKKKKRRRRRGGRNRNFDQDEAQKDANASEGADGTDDAAKSDAEGAEKADAEGAEKADEEGAEKADEEVKADGEETPKPKTRRRSRSRKKPVAEETTPAEDSPAEDAAPAPVEPVAEPQADEAPVDAVVNEENPARAAEAQPDGQSEDPSGPADEVQPDATVEDAAEPTTETQVADVPQDITEEAKADAATNEAEAQSEADAVEAKPEGRRPASEKQPDTPKPEGPKRKGWWARTIGG
ncbi:Rne/Rng family ribonuclease [Pontivivens insulae]|uniref:Ribonuclease E n=1 Tax=Pontivivens insulae TaxID=1639689 RepID=A0A2R8AB49_9RHOB|nr:ribonuclease E/G [Pontivivens insulae]RED11373.1 RNAse E [Pontivivens insulae]SPF29454.1 Ribonuclease E [Pontivivens insulae]